MSLRAATPADFGFVRSLTTDPAYAPFIGDDDEAALAATLASPDERLLIWQRGPSPEGFARFREIGNPSGRVELFRLALARTGGGQGAEFVAALIEHAFAVLNARRLWLDASGENHRAIKVYLRAGFVEEGRLRAHWHRPALGRAVDLVLFGMLRQDWLSARA
ncbi:MAG: GNAT family N-acetyltransferase [Paracoccaceae bacterium]